MKKITRSAIVATITILTALNVNAQNSFPASGNVSIGTSTTSAPLNVSQKILIGQENTIEGGELILAAPGTATGTAIYTQDAWSLDIQKGGDLNKERFRIFTGGGWPMGFALQKITDGSGRKLFYTGLGLDSPRSLFEVAHNAIPGANFSVYSAFTGPSINWATVGIGFNLTRKYDLSSATGAGTWERLSNYASNGGASILGDFYGGLRFITMPSVNGASNATNISDATVMNAVRFQIMGTGEVGVANSGGAFLYNSTARFTVNGGMAASTLVLGNVTSPSIGVNGGYNLFVQNGILTEKVKIAPSNNMVKWSDFVFDKDYTLLPLAEVESYIAKNHHLPEIPSTAEVHKNGVDLLEMDAKLLQKIEELTLYMIQLKKENDALKVKVDAFSK